MTISIRHNHKQFTSATLKMKMNVSFYRRRQDKCMLIEKPSSFQHLPSERWARIVRALFARTPSGMMSRISAMTAERSSRSKFDSTRCLVTVLATPLMWRPSNWRANRLPSQRSSNGTMPRKKKSHTRQPGAQKPQPGPLPTGPVLKR